MHRQILGPFEWSEWEKLVTTQALGPWTVVIPRERLLWDQ